MLKYIINIFLFLVICKIQAQGKVQENDTIPYKDRYGIRVGIDVVQPIRSLIDDEYRGLELVGDYRISHRFYIASELGYRNYTGQEDFFEYSTEGQYIKVGTDYNSYKNWLGMENMIVVGMRYAFSTFDQTVNEYTINTDPFIPLRTEEGPIDYDGLNAHWLELVLGLKVEVLHNVFLGLSFRGNVLVTATEPENFKNLYIPGFDRVFVNDFGFSFNYTVSYLIPFYRK